MTSSEQVVRIEKTAIDTILNELDSSAASGVETGGYLFGRNGYYKTTIRFATGPGPHAKRSAVQFEPDYLHVVREMQRLDPNKELKIKGAWHVHGLDGLSAGDERTLRGVCADFPGFIGLVVCGFHSKKLRAFTAVQNQIVELPIELLKEKRKLDFTRVDDLFDHQVLKDKHVVIFGAGSGGGVVANYLAHAGVGRFTIIDPEALETINLIRHIGTYDRVGQPKAEIVVSKLRQTNPDIEVRAIVKPLDADTVDEFRPIVEEADLTLGCSGSPPTNHLHNSMCRETGTAAIFGGLFAKAAGGFGFQYLPDHEDGPCLNCIFEHITGVQDDTNEALHHLANDYGMTSDELAAQQGLFIDITSVALLEAKMALLTLLRGVERGLAELPGNLVVWNAATMTSQWVNVAKREGCSVCDLEGWLNAKLTALGEDEDVEKERVCSDEAGVGEGEEETPGKAV